VFVALAVHVHVTVELIGTVVHFGVKMSFATETAVAVDVHVSTGPPLLFPVGPSPPPQAAAKNARPTAQQTPRIISSRMFISGLKHLS
jgi:hypothetical protein